MKYEDLIALRSEFEKRLKDNMAQRKLLRAKVNAVNVLIDDYHKHPPAIVPEKENERLQPSTNSQQ